jgi:hypothetical protein
MNRVRIALDDFRPFSAGIPFTITKGITGVWGDSFCKSKTKLQDVLSSELHRGNQNTWVNFQNKH